MTRAILAYTPTGEAIWGHERTEPPEWASYARESHDAEQYAPWPEKPDPSEVLNDYKLPTEQPVNDNEGEP